MQVYIWCKENINQPLSSNNVSKSDHWPGVLAYLPFSILTHQWLPYKWTHIIITCLIAFREGADKIVSISLGGSLNHSFHGDVCQAIGDVFLDRSGKQHRLLAHKSYLQRQMTNGWLYVWKTLTNNEVMLTRIVCSKSLIYLVPLKTKLLIAHQWATLLRWVTCSFITSNLGTVFYFESISNTPSCCP